MRTPTMLRWAAFAAVLAMMMPSPASAQIGGFLKRKLKEKIVQTVATEAAGAQPARTTGDSATTAVAPAGESGSSPETAAPTAKKRTRAEAVRASLFSESTLEITPELLDRFEKGLAAEAAKRKAVSAQLARILSGKDYELCLQAKVWSLPEYRKAYADYTATLRTGQMDRMKEGRDKFDAAVQPLAEPRCGLSPEKGAQMRRDLWEQVMAAGQEAAGLNESQYAILKERVVPFCTLAQTPDAEGDLVRLGRDSFVYLQTEAAALRPRCARLAPALKGS